jgi:ferric-dicitrate binding protein FerR (iron transport regulator)
MTPRPEDDPLQDDSVARLIRLAGEPRAAEPYREERSRRLIHQAWRAAVVRRRRQRWLAAGAGLAAALLVVSGLISLRAGAPLAATSPPSRDMTAIAAVSRLTGSGATANGLALRKGGELRPGALVETSAAGRVALSLGRLRSLRLDRNSRVRLLDAGRVELLAGALFLDAAPGAPPGFVVATPWGTVRERGTQFETRLAGDGLRLRVREGSVELVAGAEKDVVRAGFELLVTEQGERRTAAIGPTDPDWTWAWDAAPRFAVEGASLADFLAWFERESGQRVRLSPHLAARAGGIVLHGSSPDTSAAEMLPAVLATCGVEAVPEASGWYASEAGR